MEKECSEMIETAQIDNKLPFILKSQDDETIFTISDKENGNVICAVSSTRGQKYIDKKKENEDRVFSGRIESKEGETANIDVVCDGLGGYDNGAKASQIFCECLEKECEKKYHEFSYNFPEEFMKNVLNRVFDKYEEEDMDIDSGTTFVMSILLKDQVVILSLGDSKGFIFSPEGELIMETVEQKPKEFDNRFKLTHYVSLSEEEGANANLIIESIPLSDIPKGSILILTSDGITDNLLYEKDKKDNKDDRDNRDEGYDIMDYIYDRTSVPYFKKLIKNQSEIIDPAYLCSEICAEAKGRMALSGTDKGDVFDVKPDNASCIVRIIV